MLYLLLWSVTSCEVLMCVFSFQSCCLRRRQSSVLTCACVSWGIVAVALAPSEPMPAPPYTSSWDRTLRLEMWETHFQLLIMTTVIIPINISILCVYNSVPQHIVHMAHVHNTCISLNMPYLYCWVTTIKLPFKMCYLYTKLLNIDNWYICYFFLVSIYSLCWQYVRGFILFVLSLSFRTLHEWKCRWPCLFRLSWVHPRTSMRSFCGVLSRPSSRMPRRT